MRKGIRHDISLPFTLQTIVTDGARRTQCFLDIAGFDDAPPLRMVGPDASQKICLKLKPHRTARGALLVRSATHSPEQVLHVMTNFMSDDIGDRKISRRAKPGSQLVKECKINVKLLVARTIKGTARRSGDAATRLNLVSKKNQSWFAVLRAQLAKLFCPGILSLRQNDG